MRVQNKLIETRRCNERVMLSASHVLRPTEFDQIGQERTLQRICAWPRCGRALGDESDESAKNASKQSNRKYRLSMTQHRVYEVNHAHGFCSSDCQMESQSYKNKLTDEPLALRVAQRQKQQSIEPTPASATVAIAVQEQLDRLPSAVSPFAAAQLASALPANAAQQIAQIEISESVSPFDSSPVIESQQQQMQIIITPPTPKCAQTTQSAVKTVNDQTAVTQLKKVSFTMDAFAETATKSANNPPTKPTSTVNRRSQLAQSSEPVPHVEIELCTGRDGQLTAALVDQDDHRDHRESSDSEDDENESRQTNQVDHDMITQIGDLAISQRQDRRPLTAQKQATAVQGKPAYQRRKLKQADTAQSAKQLVNIKQTATDFECDSDADGIQSDSETQAALQVIAQQATKQGKVKTLSPFALLLDHVLLWSTSSTARFLRTGDFSVDQAQIAAAADVATPSQLAAAQQTLLQRLQLQVGHVRPFVPHILNLYEPIHRCVQTFNLVRGQRLLAAPDFDAKQWRMILLMFVVALSSPDMCDIEGIDRNAKDCGFSLAHVDALAKLLKGATAN